LRILVTGSRDWSNDITVVFALKDAVSGRESESITIVHGGCPSGADHAAEVIASCWRYVVEVHEANWRANGKAAGPIRNQEMVNAGADLCLAFIMPCKKSGCRVPQPHDSHGTADCVKRARAAGIHVREYRP
jgi:SLOG family YspA-like protein